MSKAEFHYDLHCIWCGSATTVSAPPEHIVPEAIGCPDDFVLRQGEVCASCNNGLGHIDQALIQDLEVFALIAAVERKKGRPAKVTSHGNMYAEVRNGSAEYWFNMDRTPIAISNGRNLAGFRGNERDLRASMTRNGRQAEINFSLEIGRSPKVARALVKIGAEYLCWAHGREIAASVTAGSIADFVLRGKGCRPVILFGSDPSKYEHRFDHIGKVDEEGWYCIFRIAHFEVMVDLSPDRLAFNRMAPKLYETYGSNGWMTLPLDAVRVSDGQLITKY